VKLLVKLPKEAEQDVKVAQRLQDMQSKLQAFAEQALVETDALVEKKDFGAAAERLGELSRGLSGLPVGAQATARLVALKKNPEAAAQIAAQQKAAHGAEALAAARQLQADKKDEQAYLRFKEVAQAFGDTPSGVQAAQAVAEYEKDPAFVKRARGKATEGKARAALSMADNYRNAGRTDRARQKYQELIKQYPDSESAETARQDLAKLDKQ
jgi:lipopolysaccharide biosynthesis regulator YciM